MTEGGELSGSSRAHDPDPGAVLSQLAPLFADAQGSLRDLQPMLLRAPERLAHPVRLAVVGQIKKGKSTLVNALLGERLAATGPLETTFRINEFVYKKERSAWAHYRDATTGTRRIEKVPLAELATLTVRDSSRQKELRDLTRIVVDLPDELLRSLDLIDTPGLSSIYGEDSASTLSLLTQASADELNYADAVLYLFSRDLGQQDTEVVGRFLGHGSSHVLGTARALGVVSKCDSYWPPPRPDALDYNPVEEVGRKRVHAYLSDEPQIGRLFYEIVPVAALVAEGAQTLSSEQFGWLDDLRRRLEPAELLSTLRYRSNFTGADLSPVSLAPAQRAELDRRLGPWGILRACRYLRAGCSEQETRRHLVRDSGVHHLGDLVAAHFGKRAYVIKLDRILSGVQEFLTAQSREAWRDAAAEAKLAHVRDAVESITDRQQGLRDLAILRLIGQGQLTFTEADTDRIYRLVEPGRSCADRLGLPPATPLAELATKASAEIQYWQSWRDNDIVLDAGTRDVARMLLRTAEDIYHRATRARRLLHEADSLRDQAEQLLAWA